MNRLPSRGLLSVQVFVTESVQGQVQLNRHRPLVQVQRVQICNVVSIDLYNGRGSVSGLLGLGMNERCDVRCYADTV